MTMAAALLAGGSLIQGVSAIQQGNTAAAVAKAQGQQEMYAAQAQAREYDIDAENTQIVARQQEADRYEDLGRTLGAITATLSSRGLDLSSPSAGALLDAADTYAQRDVKRIGYSALQTASNYSRASATALQQGAFQRTIMNAQASAARAAGYTSAASSLFKAASYADSLYGTKRKAA
jgi:hypothetical protein